jgi:hypothetical protein
LVNYFAKQADTTITTDTVYNTGAIGGPSDYRIVYVDNAKISLMGNFTGYGVLAIRDRSATGAAPRLIMQDNAVWYGLIIIFQDYAAGATDKTYCSLVGSSSGLGDVANLASYAMIASNTFAAGNDLIFSSAYINVDAGYLGVHSSSGIFTAGNNLTLSNGGSIVANSISVGNNAVISGDVYRNSLTHGNGFSLAGSDVHPVTFPVFSLPDFPAFSAGTQDINISSSPYTLAAGDYRNITTGNGVTLNLTGGVYNIQNLSMGNSPIIQYEGSTSTLRITGDMTLGNYPIVRPKSGSGLNATNLVIYIQGVNGLSLGNSSDIKCNLYIPNGTLTVGNGANFTGCFIAKNINAGNGADSHFIGLSAFGSGGALTTPKIIGGVILQGREFDLPNTNGYNQILYCQQALENVDNLINTKGYIWEKWQELE